MSDPRGRLAPVVRLAPAKLNLTLAVVGRRSDGYHALHSVMVPLALADRLSLAVLPAGEDTLRAEGFDPGAAADNLVLRAIALAREAVRSQGVPAPPLACRLEKRVPVAAGLAGGSSDAAAALDGAVEAWGAELDAEQRYAIAVRLGSDVPFFLVGAAALVEGRGERVTPLHGVRAAHADASGAGTSGPAGTAGSAGTGTGTGGDHAHAHEPGVLLVTAAVPAHTAAVFEAWSGGAMNEPGVARRTSEHFASEFGSGLTVRALIERAGVLASANDLWPAAAAVVPGLASLRRALTRLLARPIGLSGSGPTLWALYPSHGEAASAAAAVEAALDATTLTAPGGARPFVAATTIQSNRRDG